MTFGLVEDRAIFGPNNNDTDLELQTNGSAKVFIKPSGNVGIGTDLPTEKLQVEGKTRTQTFQMTNGAGAGKLLVSDAGGSASWTDPIWSGSGSNIFLTNGSANLGIGITNATSKLHVVGDANVTGNLSVGSIQQAAVTPVTLSPPFSNYNAGYVQAGYYKDKENMVHLQGLIAVNPATSSTTIFTLPVGFRPSTTHVFATMDYNGVVRLDIDNLGNVKIMDILAEFFITLDGISFRAE